MSVGTLRDSANTRSQRRRNLKGERYINFCYSGGTIDLFLLIAGQLMKHIFNQ
ncbi:hypothetical protein [Candidatus Regiella insecticola]|uniref:hypothetical protein n=1 Tax=Candidatus Regiella insecticola TaxID=138073 RepID=UPI0002E92F20|nr:hypothetical protein [Candidatus Regiella insecticola]